VTVSEHERVWSDAYALVLAGFMRMEAAASAGEEPREGSLLLVANAMEMTAACLRYLCAASRTSLDEVLESLWKANADEDSRARQEHLGQWFDRFVGGEDDA
jgi:hypothetical protein